MNGALAVLEPTAPRTVTALPAVGGMTMRLENDPEADVVNVPRAVPAVRIPPALLANPEPVTTTLVPTGPEAGDSAIVAPVFPAIAGAAPRLALVATNPIIKTMSSAPRALANTATMSPDDRFQRVTRTNRTTFRYRTHQRLASRDLPIGIADSVWETHETQMVPGDVLSSCTDGSLD